MTLLLVQHFSRNIWSKTKLAVTVAIDNKNLSKVEHSAFSRWQNMLSGSIFNSLLSIDKSN